MKMDNGVARFDVKDPDDLRKVTEAGLIWQTQYAQMAIDAIRAGAIDLARCKDVPPEVAAALGGVPTSG